ncbi:hypothetical protein DY000_02017028 [Brassica cretica]|uniref:Uncharacterized protein n=1 Tax=Brassica cretica TaxID=69181 RepID=A0ABQ7CT21_BRACR|nr:hypothetical protein DY000_02017028 [Brassica cretica]
MSHSSSSSFKPEIESKPFTGFSLPGRLLRGRAQLHHGRARRRRQAPARRTIDLSNGGFWGFCTSGPHRFGSFRIGPKSFEFAQRTSRIDPESFD